MTGPERKRNELKLDFDLEKNAIKNKVGNLTRLKKISLSFHLSLVITLLFTNVMYFILNPIRTWTKI